MGKRVKDPGFGTSASSYAGRMINTDGSFNIKRINQSSQFLQTYHFLINQTWWSFFGLAAFVFFLTNIVFAFIYIIIGIEQIATPSNSFLTDFSNAFFFSSQTLTTLGYGAMAPTGWLSGLISSFEAFIGLAMFSFLTGLIYGRFSKPKASVRFSKPIILRDFNHTKAIMFRIVNNRSSVMIKPKITVTLALTSIKKDKTPKRDFYNLDLERNSITYLPSTWTIVHEIDKESPLFNMPNNDIVNQNGELLVMLTYYDESFNQEVHQMYSYVLKEVLLDYKFQPAYHYNSEGEMVLDYNKFDLIEKL
ncbi:ion channel [Aurantibacter sp.]|uniref:ion channel n=1 Tax=Aurantibacter sp. TaxID=2807103 RepID=UPI0035C79C4A